MQVTAVLGPVGVATAMVVGGLLFSCACDQTAALCLANVSVILSVNQQYWWLLVARVHLMGFPGLLLGTQNASDQVLLYFQGLDWRESAISTVS